MYSLDTALHPLNKMGPVIFCALTSDVLTTVHFSQLIEKPC